MIESLSNKMTKQMLRDIREKSKDELSERIYLYFDDINQESVVYHWTYKLDEMRVTGAIEVGVKSNAICVSYFLFDVLVHNLDIGGLQFLDISS